jgi:hypothetical protein
MAEKNEYRPIELTQDDLARNFGSPEQRASLAKTPPAPQPSSVLPWVLGGAATVGAAVGAYLLFGRRVSTSPAGSLGHGGGSSGEGGAGNGGNGAGQGGNGAGNGDGDSGGGGGGGGVVNTGEWLGVRSLPTAGDVSGFDLTTNWGRTPADLRPLFALMERISGIDGSGRIFAVIARRESGFVPTAHNQSSTERDASRRAYANSKDRNPKLRFGEQAAEFGSGGLFAGLAPYFLWTGVPEVGDRAPLLTAPPEIMFLPRVAAFGAAVYLQRLVANYRLDDHLDIKVGWANPSLLKSGRGNATYKAVRGRFTDDARILEVDLDDTSTIPAKLSASRWPGVPKVFTQLVGDLPTKKGT